MLLFIDQEKKTSNQKFQSVNGLLKHELNIICSLKVKCIGVNNNNNSKQNDVPILMNPVNSHHILHCL